MLIKYRGETHKQFIDRLQISNNALNHRIRESDEILERLIKYQNVVPIETYNELLDKYNAAVEKLKNLGCWTGE